MTKLSEIKPQVNQDIIALLRHQLKLAESGELQVLLTRTYYADGTTSVGYPGCNWANRSQIVGDLQMLSFALCADHTVYNDIKMIEAELGLDD